MTILAALLSLSLVIVKIAAPPLLRSPSCFLDPRACQILGNPRLFYQKKSESGLPFGELARV